MNDPRVNLKTGRRWWLILPKIGWVSSASMMSPKVNIVRKSKSK